MRDTYSDFASAHPVLLAESDTLIAGFLKHSLLAAGFPVTHYTGGRAVLDALNRSAFAAVVLDLDVPEVDGYTLLAAIRASAQASVPVLVISSRPQEQDLLRAFDLGANDYVTIPFSPAEVVVRVRQLVRLGAHAA